MKRIFLICVVLSICILTPYAALSMDALEKAYKEKMEQINRDIKFNDEASHRNSMREIEQIKSETRALQNGLNETAYDRHRKESIQKEGQDLSDKFLALKKEKQDLKIKLLEKYNTLPEWWVESENAK